MTNDYLDTIASSNLRRFLGSAREVFPDFTTVNRAYEDQLVLMNGMIRNYFADKTLRRPLSYLILGPPGAGKSFFMKCLVKKLRKDEAERSTDNEAGGPPRLFDLQAVNLSEVVDPRELHKLYEQIRRNSKLGVNTITLIDEVDVQWANGSAIKHLINPMYDGEFWDGAEKKEFGRCAFFFAGSYLQDRETLLRTQRVMAGLDINRFLLDTYLEMLKGNNSDARREIHDAQDFCYVQQLWRADADPDTDTIRYLKSLEKIRDFLSRIAGNFFEMIDVSAPLDITHEAFRISNGLVTPTNRLKPIEVTRLIKRSELDSNGKIQKFRHFESSSAPLLEYKNVLLSERLLRVLNSIEQRFRKSWPENVKEFRIKRTLLNFLTVAPLINGMRSLEQLINLLDVSPSQPVPEVKRTSSFKVEEISMIVHNPETFSDPNHVWFRLKSENTDLQRRMNRKKTKDDDLVTVPLKPKPKR